MTTGDPVKNAAERQALQKKIAELDRQLGLAFEEQKGRIPRVRPSETGFPLGSWVVTAIVGAWYFFGNAIVPDFHQQTERWALYLLVLCAAVSLLLTVRNALNTLRFRRSTQAYDEEESAELRKLRLERDTLRKQLEGMKEL